MVQSLPILSSDVDPSASRQGSSNRDSFPLAPHQRQDSRRTTACVVRRRSQSGLSTHRRWYSNSSHWMGRLAIGRYQEASQLGKEPVSRICLEL
jgi:hypothetical protein